MFNCSKETGLYLFIQNIPCVSIVSYFHFTIHFIISTTKSNTLKYYKVSFLHILTQICSDLLLSHI